MIDYNENLSIRLDSALSDTLWTPPALNLNASVNILSICKGKWRCFLHKCHMHWIFRSPLSPDSRWNEMKVFVIALDHFTASLTLLDRYDWDSNICENPRTQSWNESRFLWQRLPTKFRIRSGIFKAGAVQYTSKSVCFFPFSPKPSERLFAVDWDWSLSVFVSKAWRHL